MVTGAGVNFKSERDSLGAPLAVGALLMIGVEDGANPLPNELDVQERGNDEPLLDGAAALNC